MNKHLEIFTEDIMKTASPLSDKVDKHFSKEKKNWDEFKNNLNNPRFRNLVMKHPQADEKLKLFVQAISKHNSTSGKPIEIQGNTPGKKYTVKKYKDNTYTCSCEDFLYRKAPTNTTCKHIDSLNGTDDKQIKMATANTPKHQQEEKWSCSAACLKSVLSYYDFEISEKECIKKIGTKPNRGAETTQIVKAAKDLGFSAYEKSLSISEAKSLLDRGIPIICDIQSFTKKGSGHYVILCDIRNEECFLMDPNTPGNSRRLPLKDFEKRWHDVEMAPPHKKMIRWGVVITKKP